jgi:hypothetical protein
MEIMVYQTKTDNFGVYFAGNTNVETPATLRYREYNGKVHVVSLSNSEVSAKLRDLIEEISGVAAKAQETTQAS